MRIITAKLRTLSPKGEGITVHFSFNRNPRSGDDDDELLDIEDFFDEETAEELELDLDFFDGEEDV